MRRRDIYVRGRAIGEGHPIYVIGEIGINHNGSLDITRKLIEGAASAGVDAVKFQKRTPAACVPRDQWHLERDTPWGRMTYIDYRHRMEFDPDGYRRIDAWCREVGIQWFVSCWDEESVDFIEDLDPPVYKAASASLTDVPLLAAMKRTGKPLIASTGMSSMDEIQSAIAAIGENNLAIAHSTSAYPCVESELNLRMITTLKARYPHLPIGYSGHEHGLAPTIAAVALGATFVERHITLDRTMWGTDQSASLELADLASLVASIRAVEKSLGDGVKRVYESELGPRKKLRRANLPSTAA
jgi:N-acetylneuraminate synthase